MDKTQPKKKRPVLTDNFLEKLRELGSDAGDLVVEDVIEGIPSTAVDQITGRKRSGTLKPNETLSLEKTQEQEQFRRQLSREFFRVRQEERLVFKQEEQRTRLQIKAIQEEPKKLVESTKDLVKEVEVATILEPVEPGVYHLNFFERLKRLSLSLGKRLRILQAGWLYLTSELRKGVITGLNSRNLELNSCSPKNAT